MSVCWAAQHGSEYTAICRHSKKPAGCHMRMHLHEDKCSRNMQCLAARATHNHGQPTLRLTTQFVLQEEDVGVDSRTGLNVPCLLL